MTKRSARSNSPSRSRAATRVYASEAGSLIEIHDTACAYVLVCFAAEDEGACGDARAHPDIRGEDDVWLHWSCLCCGEGAAPCRRVAESVEPG